MQLSTRSARRRATLTLAVAGVVVAAAFPAFAGAEVEAPVLTVTVSAAGAISVVDSKGAAVSTLNADSYEFIVHDQSATANAHLSGPGVNQLTDVAGTGDATWNVTLGAGSYQVASDAGAASAVKFTVGSAAAAAPAASTPATSSSSAAAKTTAAPVKVAAVVTAAAGKACTKAGLTAKAGTVKLACSKVGKKLVWVAAKK